MSNQKAGSVHIYRVYVMLRMENNTAEKSVATQEARTWKSHVNAIIWHAPCPIASSRVEMPQTWPAENERLRTPPFAVTE